MMNIMFATARFKSPGVANDAGRDWRGSKRKFQLRPTGCGKIGHKENGENQPGACRRE